MNESIERFWCTFAVHRADLERIESAESPAYDNLLESLQRIDEGLYLEFCTTPGANELIISAEGDADLFPLVDEVVRQAPAMDDWAVFALKPKIGFPAATRWEGTNVTIGDVLVLPVFRNTGEMGLRLYVHGLTEANKTDIHNALLRALDHGLGERRFAECVESTWVYSAEDAPSQAFRLPELDAYLEARTKRGDNRV